MAGTLHTCKVRLSFPNLFRPRAVEEGQEEKYSATFLLDEAAQKSPEFKALIVAAREAAEKKWPGKSAAMIKNGQLRMPFRKGEEKEYEGYGPGIIFFSATSTRRPGVVGRDPKIQLTEDEIYAGCYVRASLTVFTYAVKGNKGVSFGLVNIQKWSDGPALGNRVPADQDFEALADEDGFAPVDGDVDDIFAGAS